MHRYVLNVSMGNSDLNSSSIFNCVFDVSLRVERFVTFLYLKRCEMFRSKKAWYSILLYRSTKKTINSAQPLQLNSTTCGRAGVLKKDRIIHSNACRKSL